jgi:hypothetical protein
MFLWFDLLAGLISNECIEFGNWQRLQLRGMADYVGMKQFRIERDLCLFDLLGSQKKEEFANAVTGSASWCCSHFSNFFSLMFQSGFECSRV